VDLLVIALAHLHVRNLREPTTTFFRRMFQIGLSCSRGEGCTTTHAVSQNPDIYVQPKSKSAESPLGGGFCSKQRAPRKTAYYFQELPVNNSIFSRNQDKEITRRDPESRVRVVEGALAVQDEAHGTCGCRRGARRGRTRGVALPVSVAMGHGCERSVSAQPGVVGRHA
jgi:hypothetical protein